MRRDTLIDFFRDLITIRGDFLVYDDGYRRRVHTYADVVVPIDYRSSPEFVARVSRLVDARLVLLGDDVAGDLHIDNDVRRSFFRDLDWQADGPMPDVEVTRDDITQIIFTSGATA